MPTTSSVHRRTTEARAGRAGRRKPLWWVDLPDEQLLKVRFRDLEIKLEETELQPCIQRLWDELAAHDIEYRPYFWLSTEWFTPDGMGGMAIPFYLAHPRLKALEKKQMLEVEGGTTRSCMRIMRHEAGHVLDNVYRLHRRKAYRGMFGNWSDPYPEFYSPKPYSKSFVLHLDMWYAQSHPAEDFAETFAVWLRPGSRWRQQYKGWRALRKLEYVDELMKQIAGEKHPTHLPRGYSKPLSELKQTLGEHYRAKRARYSEEFPDFYDRDLRRLFSDDAKYRKHPTAASFLRTIKPQLRQMVSQWTGEYQYVIEQVLDDIIDRCKELGLRLMRSPRQTRMQTIVMVTVQTMNYLHAGNHRLAL